MTSARNATDQWKQGTANEQDELRQIANFINSNGSNTSSGGGTTVARVYNMVCKFYIPYFLWVERENIKL